MKNPKLTKCGFCKRIVKLKDLIPVRKGDKAYRICKKCLKKLEGRRVFH